MGEMRRNRFADNESLELREESFFGHDHPSKWPTGLAGGLEVGSPLPSTCSDAPLRVVMTLVGSPVPAVQAARLRPLASILPWPRCPRLVAFRDFLGLS